MWFHNLIYTISKKKHFLADNSGSKCTLHKMVCMVAKSCYLSCYGLPVSLRLFFALLLLSTKHFHLQKCHLLLPAHVFLVFPHNSVDTVVYMHYKNDLFSYLCNTQTSQLLGTNNHALRSLYSTQFWCLICILHEALDLYLHIYIHCISTRWMATCALSVSVSVYVYACVYTIHLCPINLWLIILYLIWCNWQFWLEQTEKRLLTSSFAFTVIRVFLCSCCN